MKILSKPSVYIWLIIGVFVIIYAGFGVVYFQKQAEYQELQSRITPNRSILQTSNPNLGKLESQLRQVKVELGEKWTFLPVPEEAIELFDSLVEVAQWSNVEVVSVLTSPLAEEQGEGASYSVFLFDITVRGSRADILVFISNLGTESALLQGLEVESVNISSGVSEDEPDAPDTANLKLVVPTQPDLTMK